MKMRPIIVALVLSAFCCPADATSTTYLVKQSAFTKFASAVGGFGGNAGRYDFVLWTPCFPDFWHLCRTVLYSNDLMWTLTSPSFLISNSGMTFAGNVSAQYGPFSFNTNVSGPVALNYSQAGRVINFSVDQLHIPITINLPVFGPWTITTITINPNYGFSYPVTTILASLQAPNGTNSVRIAPTSIGFAYQPGAVLLNVEYATW